MSTSLKEMLARQAAAARAQAERAGAKPGSSGQAGRPPNAPGAAGDRAARPAGISTMMAPPLPDCCKRIVEAIPYSIRGEDRIKYLVEQISSLSDKERTSLRIVVENFLSRMLEVGASDIDFGGPASNQSVWLRVDGDKRPDESLGAYSIDETNVLILNILSKTQLVSLFDWRAVDISYEVPTVGKDDRPRRFRCTVYFDYDQLGLNMRAITDEVFSLGQLGFHPLIQKGLMFKHERDGLTLITGVTGSGKSTTLDAVVDANNKDFAGHIVIISKPIEYMHASKRCIVRHREVGSDVMTFKDGIVQALRQDPDIVVIGELRDPVTISAAIEITDSGHKVFSTLHTSSAVESIARIIGEYPPVEQERIRNRLADVLRCVVSQKLPPKVGGGRVLAKEVLWMTSSTRAAIKNQNIGEIYQMMWESNGEGQTTLEQDLARLVRQNQITVETAMDYANVKRRMQQLLQ